MSTNDLRTASVSLTVEELRLIRSVLADMIDMDQNTLKWLPDQEQDAAMNCIHDMNELYKKVTRELEAIVGVMA